MKKNLVPLLIILGSGLALRLLHLYWEPVLPRDAVLYCNLMEAWHRGSYSDVLEYWKIHRNWEAVWIPPLSLYLLKLPMIFGLSANASGTLVSLAMGMILLVAVYRIGMLIFKDSNGALLATALAAAHPFLIEVSIATLRDGIYMGFSVLLLYFGLRLALEEKRIFPAIAFIAILPLVLLIRYEGLELLLLFVASMPFWCYPPKTNQRKVLVLMILLVAPALVLGCFLLWLLNAENYLYERLIPRLIVYAKGHQGGNPFVVFWEKELPGLFEPIAISGLLGLAIVIKHFKRNPKFIFVACCMVFMLCWRAFYGINSSRYVNNMIIPFLLLTVYFLQIIREYVPSKYKNAIYSLLAGGLLLAEVVQDLHYNPYARLLFEVRDVIKKDHMPKRIWTNHERERLEFLLNHPVEEYSGNKAEMIVSPENGTSSYLVAFISSKHKSGPNMIIPTTPPGMILEKCYESFTNRAKTRRVIIYVIRKDATTLP